MDTRFNTFDKPLSNIEPEPKHALVLGDLQFLGRHVAKAFLDAGWRVSMVTREKIEPMHNKRLEYIDADRSNRKAFTETFSSRFFDCTVDLDSTSPDLASLSSELFFGRSRHHIHLSSDAVYQLDPTLPQPWRETELIQVSPEQKGSPAGKIFTAEEVITQATIEKGFPATIVRSSRVSGAYDPACGDYIHMLRIMDEKPIVVPEPSGCFRHIHAPDLATAILHVAEHRRETVGQTYNAAGASLLSLADYFSLLACALDRQITIVRVPLEMCEDLVSDGVYPFFYPANAVPDTTKMEMALGFLPRGFEKFLMRVADWFLKEYRGAPPAGYRALRDREEKVLSMLECEE